GAKTRADAAVVDHVVEAIGAVHRGLDRANVFARRILAVHARHRLEVILFRLLRWAANVAIDPQPVHLPPEAHLLLADDGNVVFRLAGDHAGLAAHAGGQVDDHAPFVLWRTVVVGLVERERHARPLGLLLDQRRFAFSGEAGLVAILGKRAGANHLPI